MFNQKSAKRQFQLWLPFTASAIGVTEQDLPAIHNKPMTQALTNVNRLSTRWECSLVYFTERSTPFTQNGEGLRWQYFPISFRNRAHSQTFGRQFSLSALRHLLFNRPDFVGLYGGYGRFSLLVAWLCRWLAIPYYVHWGGWPVPASRGYQKLMRYAAYVITFTERQRCWLETQKIYSGANRVSWAMGVDTTMFHPRPANPTAGNGPRLIYVGRLTPHKGVLEAIQTLRAIKNQFPTARLSIIGSHQDSSFISQLQHYLQNYGLENAVDLPGAVPYEQLPSWYAEADLFIFPSPLESFGFVVIESMACGTPVIALRGSGGPEEIISHGRDGLLTDLPNLAWEAIHLLKNPARLTELGINAVETVRKQYTLEQTVQTFMRFLDRLPTKI